MSKIRLIAICSLVLSSLTVARDATALKNDLAGILPAGKKARLAWVKGARFTEFAYGLENTVVYVVDSDDGAIRRLYPATGSGSYSMVNLSADGSRVFFYDWGKGNLVVVNWNGSGSKTVSVGGMAVEYWRNPADGSDWAIVESGDMKRVNIDATAQKVTVCPLACGGDGCGFSDDGKKFFGYNSGLNDKSAFGLYDLATNKWTYSIWVGGCQGSLRAGNSYQHGHNGSGHKEWVVSNADGSLLKAYQTAGAIETGLKQNSLNQNCSWDGGFSAEGSRFTQHPDYMTTMIGMSKVNPILIRLPDLKFVYIEDNLSCTPFCGDMDMVVLPPDPVDIKRTPNRAASGMQHAVGTSELFSLSGRAIGATGARGLAIKRVDGSSRISVHMNTNTPQR